jgi:ATP-binding cassette subfamily B protein/subfamily B ATP-binding cassette protein MsbA
MVYADGLGAVLPTVLVFVFVVARLVPRLGNLNRVRASLHASWPAVVYLTEFLRKDNKHLDRRDGKPFGGLKTGLEFRGVSLEYTAAERSAVRGLNFTLPRGGTLAIVGESGAGKSSVVDMILGLFEPTEGKILIDGVPLSEIDMKSWRQRIGIVNQDTFMFAANIRDNITFARPDASEEEVIEAARVAQAHDFICELESGYDTVLGDRGYRLSGGQRQRLALARAFVRNPDLLILDEATSDLDSNSERLLQEALERFGSDRTVIMIAHRLSTVRNVYKILVMSEGRVVEQGRHDDRVVSGGIYAKLWRIQAGDKAGETT